MRGIILAGGTGSRLNPLTKTTNKHLLPIYDKQMIFYPIETLKKSGVKDILIISGPGHAGQFLELLGSGWDDGLNISYAIQDKPKGIAHAIWVAKKFVKGEKLVVILGDNVLDADISDDIKNFKKGAKVFLKEVEDPQRYGVAEIKNEKIIKIVEKPKNPKSNKAVIGVYLYDENVFDYIENIAASARGEYEVTDLNNKYLEKGMLDHATVDGFWIDAGTFDGLLQASKEIKNGRNETKE
jgi:glucose-1-phosphate thymidylyltransferase